MRCFAGPCAWLEKTLPNLVGGVLSPPVRVEELADAAADAITAKEKIGVRTLTPDALVGYKSWS